MHHWEGGASHCLEYDVDEVFCTLCEQRWPARRRMAAWSSVCTTKLKQAALDKIGDSWAAERPGGHDLYLDPSGELIRCRQCVRTWNFQVEARVWMREVAQTCDVVAEATMRVQDETRFKHRLATLQAAADGAAVKARAAAARERNPAKAHALRWEPGAGVVVCDRCGYWSRSKWEDEFAKRECARGHSRSGTVYSTRAWGSGDGLQKLFCLPGWVPGESAASKAERLEAARTAAQAQPTARVLAKVVSYRGSRFSCMRADPASGTLLAARVPFEAPEALVGGGRFTQDEWRRRGVHVKAKETNGRCIHVGCTAKAVDGEKPTSKEVEDGLYYKAERKSGYFCFCERHLDAAARAADDAAAGRPLLVAEVEEPRVDSGPEPYDGPRIPRLHGGGSGWVRGAALGAAKKQQRRSALLRELGQTESEHRERRRKETEAMAAVATPAIRDLALNRAAAQRVRKAQEARQATAAALAAGEGVRKAVKTAAAKSAPRTVAAKSAPKTAAAPARGGAGAKRPSSSVVGAKRVATSAETASRGEQAAGPRKRERGEAAVDAEPREKRPRQSAAPAQTTTKKRPQAARATASAAASATTPQKPPAKKR